MEEVYIDIRKENSWIQKYFTTDFVSISNLISIIEDLDGEIESLKEKIEELTTTEEDEDLYRDR